MSRPQPSLSNSTGQSFLDLSDQNDLNRLLSQLRANNTKGTIIELKRGFGQYNDFALFEKIDGNQNIRCFRISSPVSENNSSTVGTDKWAQIKYECLDDILRNPETGELSLCRVNNQTDLAQKLMTANRIRRPNIDAVFQELHRKKDFFIKYDKKHFNSEHYVTYWKYGFGWSNQVTTKNQLIKWASMITSVTGGACALIGTYGWWCGAQTIGVAGAYGGAAAGGALQIAVVGGQVIEMAIGAEAAALATAAGAAATAAAGSSVGVGLASTSASLAAAICLSPVSWVVIGGACILIGTSLYFNAYRERDIITYMNPSNYNLVQNIPSNLQSEDNHEEGRHSENFNEEQINSNLLPGRLNPVPIARYLTSR